MCCHCPAGWAGLTLHPPKTQPVRLCLADELWLDTTPRLFVSLPPLRGRVGAKWKKKKRKRSVKHCWTRLMALNLHISRPGCTAGARSGGHLKDRHCWQVKDSACTPSCFRFSTKRNLISLSQFIMSPHVCGEISQSVDSNKVYKDPADFKRLTAQCGFLTERSNQGCVGRVDISFCRACAGVPFFRRRSAHTAGVREVLLQQQSTEYFTGGLKSHTEKAAWTSTCLLCRDRLSSSSLTMNHSSRYGVLKKNKWVNYNSRWGDFF